MSNREPVCFSCGHSTTAASLGNRLADGRPCPSCFDRLLDAQPPLLPNFSFDGEFEEEGDYDYDDDMTVTIELESDDDDPIGA